VRLKEGKIKLHRDQIKRKDADLAKREAAAKDKEREISDGKKALAEK
jgi:hypothetical protein